MTELIESASPSMVLNASFYKQQFYKQHHAKIGGKNKQNLNNTLSFFAF